NCRRGSSGLAAGGSGLAVPGSGRFARDQLFLDRCIFRLKARDLGLERGALVRHRLTCPSRPPLPADRYLGRAAVKPQIAVINAVERVSAIVALRRGGLPPSHGRYETQRGDND